MDILKTFIGLALANCDVMLIDSELLDEVADMSVIEDNKQSGEDGVGGDEEEAVIEEGVEIEGESLEGRFILFDQVEWGHVGCEGGEEHVDHEHQHHFLDHFVVLARVGVVVGVAFGGSYYSAEEGAEKWDYHCVYEGEYYALLLDCLLLVYEFAGEGYD